MLLLESSAGVGRDAPGPSRDPQEYKERNAMELELNTTHLNCYDTVLDTTLFHEETLETIVPDACPDILRIVDCEAMVCLKGKEAQEGRAEISGSVRAAVLYLPDGAEGIRRMTVTIPFTCSAEALGIHAGCLVTAMPRVHSADARSLNPRKVLTRVDLAVEVSVFARQTESLCDGVTCPAEGGIQQLTETQNAYLVTAVEEKPFSFSDDVSISGAKPRAEELLKSRADIECSESKLIGNKLIFKGEVHLQLLYRDPSNTLCPASFDLPFSQIMEVSGVEEEADCALQVQLTGCECILNDGNDGDSMISVALALLAQAVVREVRPVQLLSDVYSTVCGLHAERRTYTFHQLVENGERRVMVREILETMTAARSVADIYVNVGGAGQTREGERVTLTADTTVTVVYIGEDGGLSTITRPLQAACPVDLPGDCAVTCRCRLGGERFATPAGGGVEVRYSIDFQYLALTARNTTGVSDIQMDEDSPRDTANQPSIVLRMVGEGERLWDIAKAYGTTTGDIVQANALEEESLPMGQLLLIPKKR